MTEKIRVFPLQGEGFVTWEEAEVAFVGYEKFFGKGGQSLERLGERGGFGRREFLGLYLSQKVESFKGMSLNDIFDHLPIKRDRYGRDIDRG